MFTYMCASKVGFSLLHVDNCCGHVVQFLCFRVFICDNMLCTYAYLHMSLYIYIHIYSYIYTHIHICVWQANCVASVAVCTLFRAYGQFLTISCSRIWQYVLDIQIPGARKPSLPLPNHSQKNSCWRPLITAAFVLLWLNVCPEWISEFSCTNIETHCCRMCMVLGTVVGLCWKSRPNRGVWRLAGRSTSSRGCHNVVSNPASEEEVLT